MNKNVILLILTILSCSIYRIDTSLSHSLNPEFNSDVLDFVKINDKQELMNMYTLAQEHQAKLKANKDDHYIMCEKSLNTCKLKFNNNMCDVSNEYENKDLKEGLSTNTEAMQGSLDMLNKLSLLVKQNEDDCKQIESLFEENKTKFTHNTEFISKLIEKIGKKVSRLQFEEEKRKEKELQDKLDEIKNEKDEIVKQVNNLKAQEESLKKVQEENFKLGLMNSSNISNTNSSLVIVGDNTTNLIIDGANGTNGTNPLQSSNDSTSTPGPTIDEIDIPATDLTSETNITLISDTNATSAVDNATTCFF